MRVRFIGHVDVAVEVPGAALPLVLPAGLSIDRLVQGRVDEVLIRPTSAVSTFVGRLNIPYVKDRTIRLASLDVPPPEPWGMGDLRTMLTSTERIRQNDLAGGGALHHTPHASRYRSRDDLAWTALTRCAAAAQMTLTHWPSRTTTRNVRHPLELSRGIELIDATERQLGSRIDLLGTRGGRRAPTVTIRRVAQVEEWRNRALAAVTSQVCAMVRSVDSHKVFGDVPASLISPVAAVAYRSRPTQPIADPPFSSWPPVFVEAYSAAVAVLSTVRGGGNGRGWIPLADLWRLYEGWLAERVLGILTRLLGPPVPIAAEGRVACAWSGDNWQLELRHPCPFTQHPRSMLGSTWWSTTSKLDPDVALIGSGPAGSRLVILDAKLRGRLLAGDLAAEASKYLWGLRKDSVGTYATQAVVLVSPFGGDNPYDVANARQWSIHGHPNAPRGRPAGQVGTDIDSALIKSLLVDQLSLPLPA